MSAYRLGHYSYSAKLVWLSMLCFSMGFQGVGWSWGSGFFNALMWAAWWRAWGCDIVSSFPSLKESER